MDESFQVGEVAELRNFNHGQLVRLNGEEVVIRGPLAVRPCLNIQSGAIRMAHAYAVEWNGVMCAVGPENLRKKPGERADKTRSIVVSSWDKCPWKPQMEEA